MHKATGLLALCGAALMVGSAASAQTVTFALVDTFGDGTKWNIGAARTNGAPIGYNLNGGGSNLTPTTPVTAAYAALPFTVNALPGAASALSSVDIVLDILPSSGTTSNVASLHGAIYSVPAGVTTLSGATKIGSTFTFDTSNSTDAITPSQGSNKTQLVTTINANTAGITFAAGVTYWLVIEPKDGLNPTGSNALLDWGNLSARTQSDVLASAATLTASNGLLSNAYTSVGQALDTFTPTNAGDANTLQPVTIQTRTSKLVAYFGARINMAISTTVKGKLALEGVSELSLISPNAPLGAFTFQFRTPGTQTALYTVNNVTLTTTPGSGLGSYTISGIPTGTYDVAIKGLKNLQIVVPNVTVSVGTVTLPNETLPAADANNDNAVDIADFGILINAYGGDSSIFGSNYNATVDFNFDGIVDIADFGILINEYGNVGAP